MKRVAAAILALAGIPTAAYSQSVVVALSTERVEVSSNFTGASVTVFGALEDPAIGAADEIIIVLRGPMENVVARRKDRLLGLWINRAEARFEAVPAYYALQATRPIEEIADPVTLATEGLGLASLVDRNSANPEETEFAEALVRLRQDIGLYYETIGGIDRPGGTVFRTRFDLPADAPIGAYLVDVFLFQSGSLVATSSVPMEITKTGAEQFIFDASRDSPWLYAIAVVLIAAAAGWLGGVLFRRD